MPSGSFVCRLGKTLLELGEIGPVLVLTGVGKKISTA
jgi:hypothetical protein